jgi:hypothetical protein
MPFSPLKFLASPRRPAKRAKDIRKTSGVEPNTANEAESSQIVD